MLSSAVRFLGLSSTSSIDTASSDGLGGVGAGNNGGVGDDMLAHGESEAMAGG